MTTLVEKVEQNILNKKLIDENIKLSPERTKTLIGAGYDGIIAKVKQLADSHMNKLGHKSHSFMVTRITLISEGSTRGISILCQAKTKSGAVNFRAFIPMSFGSPSIKFIDTVGNL
jgi:hypothetical protein